MSVNPPPFSLLESADRELGWAGFNMSKGNLSAALTLINSAREDLDAAAEVLKTLGAIDNKASERGVRSMGEFKERYFPDDGTASYPYETCRSPNPHAAHLWVDELSYQDAAKRCPGWGVKIPDPDLGQRLADLLKAKLEEKQTLIPPPED